MTTSRKFDWTPGRDQTVRDMWARGCSAGEISAALGYQVTRNAVVGKAHRMLRAAAKAAAQPEGEALKAARPAQALSAADARRQIRTVHTRNHRVMPAEPVTLAPDGPAGGIDFETMSTDNLCAWGINTPAIGRADDLRFCGARREGLGGRYCAAHQAIAHDASRKAAANKHARSVAAKARREGVA